MQLLLDISAGFRYIPILEKNRPAKGQSHRKMAAQNHGSTAIMARTARLPNVHKRNALG
jgi:hypothetical protein